MENKTKWQNYLKLRKTRIKIEKININIIYMNALQNYYIQKHINFISDKMNAIYWQYNFLIDKKVIYKW